MLKKFVLLAIAVLMFSGVADAGLTGHYYNLPESHPDMQGVPITGVRTGWVDNILAGDSPTLTALGAANIHQFDWYDAAYHSFSRVDSDADLQYGFASSWFPVNENLNGDPFHFAVHWEGSFYVANDMVYNYQMGSDDDSWLYIDNNLELDLGGVHALSMTNDNVYLTAGWHNIDIFFAERHTVQSGFKLNFFTDLQETTPSIPEPATVILLGLGLAGLTSRKFRK